MVDHPSLRFVWSQSEQSDPKTMPHRRIAVVRYAPLACLAALLCSGAHAQQTQTQQLPEIDTYVDLTDGYRLMFMASRSDDGNTVDSAQFGPNLDINFRPLRRRPLRTNDSSKSNFLTLRTGYQYLKNFNKPNENRVQMALTSHLHLPWSLELAERNRIDLRVISDQFSWRYRNRLTLERSFHDQILFFFTLCARRNLLRQQVGRMEQEHLFVWRDVPDSQAPGPRRLL